MSDLAATNCGCGCENGVSGISNNNSNWILILILLVVAVYWLTIPLLILGLFLGFRYRFSGPDLERDDINDAMDAVADTAAGLGRRVADEFRNQRGGHGDDEE